MNVGDIDGGGRDVIAVQYPGGVRFLSGGEQITNTGVPRFLPHPRERRCFSTVSVEEGLFDVSVEEGAGLDLSMKKSEEYGGL